MIDKVLDPGVVGVPHRWHAVLPALIIGQPLAAPVAHVEGRIGQQVVRLEILVEVVVESISRRRPQVGVDAANGQIHLGQPPGGGVGLLTVDGDVANLPAVGFHELFGLHEHAARAAAGVVHAALVGLDHLDQQLHHALGRVELPAALTPRPRRTGPGSIRTLALGVLDPGFLRLKIDVPHELDQFAKADFV